MKGKELVAIDINSNMVESKGTAYYRLDDEMFEFLKKCDKYNDKEKIIGFEWDGSRNFGIILGK